MKPQRVEKVKKKMGRPRHPEELQALCITLTQHEIDWAKEQSRLIYDVPNVSRFIRDIFENIRAADEQEELKKHAEEEE